MTTDCFDNHTLAPEVQALLKRLKLKRGDYLVPLLNGEEYKRATLCGLRMKGSIALVNASLSNRKRRLIESVRHSCRQRGIF